jgi:hypothetical protein
MSIAALNDRFRMLGPEESGIPGRILATRGVASLPPEQQQRALLAVRASVNFHDGNDPHGEHDFGRQLIDGVGAILWKIDYYADAGMADGSEAPEDPTRCYRVLTIMLASEYSAHRADGGSGALTSCNRAITLAPCLKSTPPPSSTPGLRH